jgi:hypothetical protein
MASVIAHEITESITDTSAGWWDSAGLENADKCAWNFPGVYYTKPNNGGAANVKLGPTMDFLIQSNWINYGAGCCGMTWPIACPFSSCC